MGAGAIHGVEPSAVVDHQDSFAIMLHSLEGARGEFIDIADVDELSQPPFLLRGSDGRFPSLLEEVLQPVLQVLNLNLA